MKNRLFRHLVSFFVFGLLTFIIQNKNFADVASVDFNEIKKLAEKGDSDAQYKLGQMYRKGKGISRDYKQAAYWYTKAAEQGNAHAQFFLGKMYWMGKGIPQDEKQAVKQAVYWWTKAAEQGNAHAQ